MRKRFFLNCLLILALVLVMSTNAFAISESDVESAVSASGKEAVSGNVLVWFLCAIAFLKVSQKIDSFLSSLGLNVGHTGGSMLSEAMIAMRAINTATSAVGSALGGHSRHGSVPASGKSDGGSAAAAGFFSGGLVGMASRKITSDAVRTATTEKNIVQPQQTEATVSRTHASMEGLQLTMQRVKIPGGGNLQFEIRSDDPDNPDYERKLVGVILYHHLANAYWPEGSEYDDNVPPFCQSFDGKQGYGEPGGVCAACAFNQFGSTANGSGKACKNMRQIYLLRSGEYLPLQLSLPPTSLRPFNDFMNLAFVARRRPSYSAIVEIGLKRAESGGYTYSVATFRKVRDLEGEGLAAVKSYAANFKEQVKSLLAQRVENYKSDVESLTGTAPLELADNGDHFSYPGVIDGERDELPL